MPRRGVVLRRCLHTTSKGFFFLKYFKMQYLGNEIRLPSVLFHSFYSLPSKGSISELSGLVLEQTPVSDTFVTQTLPISCEAWVSCGSESRNGTGGMGGQRGGAYRVITINLSMRFRANKKLLSQLEYESEKNRKLSPQFFFPEKTQTLVFFTGSRCFKIPVCC